jgi:hypothetical protein
MAKRSRRDSLSPLSDQLSVGSPSPAVSMTESPPPAKMTELDSDSVDPVVDFIRCSLPPHRDTYTFSSYEEYEVHYAKDHVNRCTECGKNFPTYHFLDLHIEENHDPLLAARKDRGEKTYSCFVEGCERKCSTPQKRRRHLIDKHMFPKTYNFFIINDGIDKHNSLLRRTNSHRRRLSTPLSPQDGRLRNRQTSISSPSSQSKQAPSNKVHGLHAVDRHANASASTDIEALEKSMSALRFVPSSVTKQTKGDRKARNP